MTARDGLLVVTTVSTGVVAGVFFAFSTFVMAALARLPAAQGAAAMQAINVVAVNRWFMTPLFGSAVLAIALSATSFGSLGEPRARWLFAGTALYVLGAVVVTACANVPRNEALSLLDGDGAAAYFPRYVAEWGAWNHVRTGASALATACLILACRS